MKEKINPSEILSGKGSIDIITGPMFSGKSDELIRRLTIAGIAIKTMQNAGVLTEADLDQRIMVFKPTIDKRRGERTVNSENGQSYPAIPIENANRALELITKDTLIVAFDEAQFWSEDDLVETCRELARKKGLKVIVVGLSLNFKGEKWGGIGVLALEAEHPDFLSAVCTKCGDAAIFTQRIIEEDSNGKKIRRPASYNDPVEVVGGTNLYEARCRQHHEVPGRPGKNKS
ncbi:MAG: thymidine kinase [Candidatus Woesebacteria bacterium]|nr:MAG: thymidine kinase [Candidatus Woesebacteria bacterium]